MEKDITILLVDDNKSITKVIEKSIKRLEYNNIMVFNDPIEADNHLKENIIDLIISDLEMKSSIDGLDLVKKAKKYNPNQIAYILSGSNGERINSAREYLGENYVLAKPYHFEMIKSILEKTTYQLSLSSKYGKSL